MSENIFCPDRIAISSKDTNSLTENLAMSNIVDKMELIFRQRYPHELNTLLSVIHTIEELPAHLNNSCFLFSVRFVSSIIMRLLKVLSIY